jgi:hypothetical protein
LRASLAVAALLLAVVGGGLGTASPASALLQLLQNPGFEAGTAGWSGNGLSTDGCAAASGSAALALTPAGGSALAQQQVEGAAAGAGPYTLTGVARAGSGSPAGTARLRFIDPGGDILADQQVALPLGGAYAPFEVAVAVAPAGSAGIVVRITVTGSGVACVDSLSLEGPAPATVTPSPLPTATPTTPPTATATAPAQATSTASPPPAATNTPAPAATPTAVSAAAQQAAFIPVETIANGGFELGLAPWQKFGGELALVASPANSGSAAASLASGTASTKWAYQVVRIAPGGVYDFSGHLLAGEGVAEAYLRISWYASADGGGRALGNSDSASRVAGAAPYTLLATGPVQAPASASSARVRVMLAPAGSAPAVLYFDDMAFGPSAEPSPATAVVAPATPEDDATEPEPAPPQAAAAAATATAQPPAATPTLVASSRAAASGGGLSVSLGPKEAPAGGGASSTPWVVVGVVAAVAGVGWAVWYTRRAQAMRP